ncbi:MAG: hypothetical protein K9J37_22700 [Saprospiraceae bacterium]|nr:hypothetical protein [Saprospiraceae bacterium]MCF8252735.1 hypothetical protein [Saprospiraceae bacterium]MCF8282783.1 hypothetical protein [Bacteroidales bacterium]MCF8313331.1 hypothetical protein [Saprospiraceae bacterium]MCF8441713.1 hypothetical protein [Saprospiraceae bacterium]
MKSNWRLLSVTFLAMSLFSCTNDDKTVEAALEMTAPQPHTVAVSRPAPEVQPVVKPHIAGTPRTAEQMVAAGYKRYGIEKGALIFRLDGAVNGTEHIFFDHWGWREAKYTRTSTELGTFNEETDEAQYLEGERRYVYDVKTKKARYFDSQSIIKTADQYNTKDMVVVGNEMLKNMGMTPAGKANVGTTECDVWVKATPKIRLYMWQGLTLAEESYVNNIPIGRRCLQMELEKDPPLERLLLPKGVEVVGEK